MNVTEWEPRSLLGIFRVIFLKDVRTLSHGETLVQMVVLSIYNALLKYLARYKRDLLMFKTHSVASASIITTAKVLMVGALWARRSH